MDKKSNDLFDVFQNSSFLSDYGGHIFVIIMLIFGFLTYFLSIKPVQPIIGNSKNIKKRITKEKISKNIDVNDSPSKFEVKNDSFKFISAAKDSEDADVPPNENDDQELWIPVQKSKKSLKNENSVIMKANSDIKKPKSQLGKHQSTANSNSSVTICDAPTRDCIDKEKLESKAKTTSKEKSGNGEKNKATVKVKSKLKVNDDKSFVTEVFVLPVVDRSKNVKGESKQKAGNKVKATVTIDPNESLTNSSNDDFVFVGGYKTSSGNEIEVDDSRISEISVTSGASRKKNKKQQQVVSKKPENVTTKDGKSHVVSGMQCPVIKVDNTKKKRPRKDN